MRKKLHHSRLSLNGSSVRYLSLLYCFCLALVLPISTATADEVSRFDVAQSCRNGKTIQLGMDPFTACMKQEDDALDELKAQWSQFSQADKTACIRLSSSGGVAGSYIELLTCLQMKKGPETFLSAPKRKTENSELPIIH